MDRTPSPLGLKLLVAFFAFGTTMCLLTLFLLLFPGSGLEPLWRLNPEAQRRFQSLGGWALVLMLLVGTACAFAAAGLALRAEWARKLAVGILVVNLLGDLANTLLRHDYRTLIGLPIGGLFIAYLLSNRVRRVFVEAQRPASG